MSEAHLIDIRAALIGQQVIDLVRESGVLHKKRGRKAQVGGKKRGRKSNAEREALAAQHSTAKAPRKPRPSELAKKTKKVAKPEPPVDERDDEDEDDGE